MDFYGCNLCICTCDIVGPIFLAIDTLRISFMLFIVTLRFNFIKGEKPGKEKETNGNLNGESDLQDETL